VYNWIFVRTGILISCVLLHPTVAAAPKILNLMMMHASENIRSVFFFSYIVYLLLRREVRVTPPRCRLYTQVGSDSPMCFFISPAYMLSSVLIELHLPYIKAASRRVHGGIRNYLCCLRCRPCLSSRSLVDVFVLGG